MAEENQVFNRLQALSRQYQASAKGLPAQAEVVPTKAVVCFSLLGVQVAVAVEEIVELLEIPATTRLPRVKNWVKGVANVRGRLLPVMDFARFLGGATTTPPKQQRVIVLDIHDIFVGLGVDTVYAMRHFRLDTYSESVDEAPATLQPYVEGSFSYNDESWFLFRPARLIQDPAFMAVAA
jgi:twitching motility protein PilI